MALSCAKLVNFGSFSSLLHVDLEVPLSSLMHMIGKLPHIRVAGENNNALLGVKQIIDKINTIKDCVTENDGPWKHHVVSDASLCCFSQTAMETINPTLAKAKVCGSDHTIYVFMTTEETI